jgi:vacuolar-type H+-ATPase subunit F/Vma7
MSKKKKSKNYNSPNAIIGNKNKIRSSDDALIIVYERFIQELQEEIRRLQNDNSFLRAQLSIKNRWFPE